LYPQKTNTDVMSEPDFLKSGLVKYHKAHSPKYWREQRYDYGHLIRYQGTDTDYQQRKLFSAEINRIGMRRWFNRTGWWAMTERYEHEQVLERGDITVIAGVITRQGMPAQFYKVYAQRDIGAVIAFLFDAQDEVEEPLLQNRIVSLSCIERKAGIKLLAGLDNYDDVRGDKAFSLDFWTQGDQHEERGSELECEF
jgi:DNA/RNA endonuclease G (NUC1)